ncbi:MAG: PilZ domain-containing protein [Candidatus Sulfotelmatobacter sp.]
MQVVSFPARQARTGYRHELRTLTYVTLDAANGGIVRNLNRYGVAVQAVAPLRPQQRVRLRFELRFPRLRVEAHGHVTWASSTGQCGIRFVDLSTQTARQIDEWIFSNLLESLAREAAHPRSIFGASVVSIVREENGREENGPEENDGLNLSAPPRPSIRLQPNSNGREPSHVSRPHRDEDVPDVAGDPGAQLNWLSRPLSGRTLAWLVDSLVVMAALLLFALIFLSIAHELPQWPLTVAATLVAAVFVSAAYWALFAVFGGASLGARLADAASASGQEGKEYDAVHLR